MYLLLLDCCISLLQNLVAQNNTYLLPHIVFLGREFGSSLVEWFWLKISYMVVVTMLARVAVIWKFDWSYWSTYGLITEGLSPSPCGPLHRAAWGSSQYGSLLFPEWVIQEKEQGGSHIAFYVLISGITYHHFCHILIIRSKSQSIGYM